MKKNDSMKLQKRERRRKRMNDNNGQKPISSGTGTTDPKKRPQGEPKVGNKLIFTFYDTNPPSVRVEGVPPNLQAALRQVNAATELVVRMFMDKGRDGLLDDQYNILEETSVLPVSTPILGPDGKKLN